MASRRSAYITAYEGSSLVAPFNDGPPLLPYERQLIAAIGISESEYRQRLRELYSIANRPAGYGHIPDVQNDPVITPILVSLAVGLVTTGISCCWRQSHLGPQTSHARLSTNSCQTKLAGSGLTRQRASRAHQHWQRLVLLSLTSSAITTDSKASRTAKPLSQAGLSLNLFCCGHGWSASAPTRPSSC